MNTRRFRPLPDRCTLRHRLPRLLPSALVLLLLGGIAVASTQDAPPRVAAERAPAASTRVELARSLIRFERALAAATERLAENPAAREALLRRMNERFDALTLLFFAAQSESARERLDELTASLLAGANDDAPVDLIAPRDDPGAAAAASAQRAAVVDRLAELEQRFVSDPGSIAPQSMAAIRSRAALLLVMLDHPDGGPLPRGTPLAGSVLPVATLTSEVNAELARLLEGHDPSIGEVGDRWREIEAGGVRLRLRESAVRPIGTAPRPLIIALHGAGGDENMFMEAYGAGVIKALAAKHDAVVVSPLTTVFATSPRFFDAIVEEMERCHGIDRRRVVVVGHSMGAAAVASLLGSRGEAIAAAAMIAGGGSVASRETRLPPLRIDAGELDPLIPAARLEKQADEMRGRGMTVTCVVHPGRGHTLLVGEILPEVVAWLLDHAPPRAAVEPAGAER